MEYPDPIDYGFLEGENTDLLRLIISSSAGYWAEDDEDLEMSYAHIIVAEAEIIRFIYNHKLAVPMPEFESQTSRSIKFSELEADDNADLDEYESYADASMLHSIFDDLGLLYVNNGVSGFDIKAINLILFSQGITWYECGLGFSFHGEDENKLQRLLEDVIICHVYNNRIKNGGV